VTVEASQGVWAPKGGRVMQVVVVEAGALRGRGSVSRDEGRGRRGATVAFPGDVGASGGRVV